MNGGSDSDEESAGMAYFLPIGIADDSPPKRSMAPPGSFGPIGGRTPTAAAGLGGGGFHRSNSPSYLHLNSPSTVAPAVATPLSGAASAVGSSSASGNYLLSDLGGEIHQPRSSSGFSGATDSASANIGPFGFAIGSFRNTTSRSEDESEARAEPSSLFGRPSAAAASVSGSNDPFSRIGASSAGSLFGRAPSDLTMSAPFMNGGSGISNTQESSPFSAAARNWPPSSSPSSTMAASTAGAPTNPRRVFQAPPGLGGPAINSPQLELGGGDYLSNRLMSASESSSGLQHQSHVSGAFGAFSASATPAVSDAFRSSSHHQFGSSLSSPLASLHLTPGVFAGGSTTPQLLSAGGGGITNPDLAELNSLSMKMQDAVDDAAARRSARELPAQQTSKASEIQSTKMDVQARPKKAKAPTGPLDQSMQQQQQPQSNQPAKRLEKKKHTSALADFSPQSPSSHRDVLASPASAGRIEARHVKTAAAVTPQQKASSSTASPLNVAAPRSAPAPLADAKSSRAKKSRGQERAGDHAAASGRISRTGGAESVSVSIPTGPTATAGDADYESSDSADVGLASDAWESPIKVSADARRGQQVRDKSSTRGAKKSAARAAPEKTATAPVQAAPAASTARRQVYREKQPKENASQGNVQRQSSTELAPSTDGLETPSASPTVKSEPRESKTRSRRAKDAASAPASDVSTPAESKSAPPSATRASLEHIGSSDIEVSKGKRSPKHSSKASKASAAAAAETAKQQQASASSATADSSTARSSAVPQSPTTAVASTPETMSASTPSKSTALDAAKSERATKPAAQQSAPRAAIAENSDSELANAARVKRDVESPPNEEISPTESPSLASQSQASTPEKKQQMSAAAPTPAPAPVRKDKSSSSKREKAEKKKSKQQRKEKRESPPRSKGESVDVSDISDLDPGSLELPAATTGVGASVSDAVAKLSRALMTSALSAVAVVRDTLVTVSHRLNVKGTVSAGLYHLESVAAVVFSVVLLLSLHGASWFIRIHRVAFRAILTHRHIGFCFAFLYAFPFLVQYVFPWAPPWAPVCLWYAFLVQLFCTNGSTAMVTTFRILLPLVFLVEGISHHSFLLDLNGAELLLTSFIISAMKTSNLCSPIFFISLAAQCLSAVFLGSELVVQWFQMALALYSLHSMVASEEDWNGFHDDEDELACQPMAMHHSIADYSHHPAPSATSIQKTKRLDRRALAYVRGRKFR